MTTMSAGQALAGKALGAYPSYGLTMRFQVSVDDLSLGQWQSCEGLGVELKYKKFEQGGQYTQPCVLPEKLDYGKVTLRRAINQSDSAKVQQWLQSYVENWQIAAVNGQTQQTSVTIVLLDFQLNEVMTWTLYNARPCKWQGPTLNAGDNKIAMESLELEHEGFLYIPE